MSATQSPLTTDEDYVVGGFFEDSPYASSLTNDHQKFQFPHRNPKDLFDFERGSSGVTILDDFDLNVPSEFISPKSDIFDFNESNTTLKFRPKGTRMVKVKVSRKIRSRPNPILPETIDD